MSSDDTIRIDGRLYRVQRIPISELDEWRARLGLKPVRTVGGPRTWPPAVLYERIKDDTT